MALPQLEYISNFGNRSFLYKLDRDVWPVYHFHPEVDLILILKNTGEFISGDRIGRMEPGTLFLNGPNVPHAVHPTEAPEEDWDRPSVAVLHFSEASIGKELLDRDEMALIRDFLREDISRGFEFHGETRQEVADFMMAMQDQDDLERYVSFLKVLHLLAKTSERTPLASEGYRPSLRAGNIERVDRVVQFLKAHRSEPLTLDQVASVASLTPKAFCRFFRSATGRTLVQYLHELRVGEACRLLLETEMSISEVALDSGFPSLAHFNRKFRDLKGEAPSAFRKRSRLEPAFQRREMVDIRQIV